MAAGYITVGGSHHYTVTPYMPDMSWLGEPPSSRMAARYEVSRRTAHRAALTAERSKIQAALDAEAKNFVETPHQRQRQTARINELQAQLSTCCECDICREVA